MDVRFNEMIGKDVRHFKGGIYSVIGVSVHTETGEVAVIYKSENKNIIYARPYHMFMSLVDTNKYPEVIQKYRFEVIK